MVIDKVIKTLTVIICVIFVLNIVLFINAHYLPASISNKAAEGMPYYFQDSQKYWSEITDVLACGDYIYVMYDSKEVLTCYDMDGNYLHSYAFDMIKNGRTHCYSMNGLLFVETKGHDLYIFDNGQFASYYPWDSGQVAALRPIESDSPNTHPENQSVRYELRKASVWRVGDGKQTEVLHRSAWLMIFQGPMQIIIHIMCLLSLVLLYYFYWKK